MVPNMRLVLVSARLSGRPVSLRKIQQIPSRSHLHTSRQVNPPLQSFSYSFPVLPATGLCLTAAGLWYNSAVTCDNSEATSNDSVKSIKVDAKNSDVGAASEVDTSADNHDPFFSPGIQAALEKRREREAELEVFSRKAKNRMFYLRQRVVRRELSESKYQIELQKLKEEILLEAGRILYGVEEPHMREKYLQKYGCTHCTDSAVESLKDLQPLVEVGAGLGHWNKALKDAGIDIVSYDNQANVPLPNHPKVGEVIPGDETKLSENKGRTLLLVYPPPGPMAMNCLKHYRGKSLVYVGEERNGCNANEEFFDELGNNWKLVKIVSIDPFPECFEKLYVLERAKSSSWWKFW